MEQIHSHTEAEEIEGVDDSSSPYGKSPYPLDDIMVRSEHRTVVEVMRRIDEGRYILDPDFQRDFVWDQQKQSKLIESCIMRIPLPVFYVAEGEDGKITVVDGLQRLSTFRAFLRNKLKLTKLGEHSPFNGKTFKGLPLRLQNRVEDTPLTMYILDSKAPEAARLDIFDRVNSGVALSRQQMRNALHSGPATQWLAKMSKSKEFLKATGGSLSKKTMRDREAINRFLAFHRNGWKNYSGEMDLFLAEALKDANKWDEEKFEETGSIFKKSMQLNFELFGKHAFRKSITSASISDARTVINISLFDVLSVAMSDFCGAKFDIDISNNEKRKNFIIAEVTQLLNNDDFTHAITYSTNSTSQVHTRFRMVGDGLGDLTEA